MTRCRSVAFTGHQEYDGQADRALRETIRGLQSAGCDTFLCGMASGFDLAAAEAVMAVREACPGLRLVAVVPFAGQEQGFSAADQVRYRAVREAANEVVVLEQGYRRGCYYRRNDYLVDHADVVVAWYKRSRSGTGYTVRRAKRQGVEVVNLFAPTLF